VAIDKAKYKRLLAGLGKRPRTVLEILLKNGEVSTYELGELGYDQPPRAAQDLKEHGVRLVTTFGKHPKTNARMAIYRLAEDGEEVVGSSTGRVAFPKAFREEVFEHFNNRCNVCNVQYNARSLQLDHRIPFLVAGEAVEFRVPDFQPLCNSHQRAKSWECEHCPAREAAETTQCKTCYWAIPDGSYLHIAGRQERRADVTFVGEEIAIYDALVKRAKTAKASVAETIKNALKGRK